MNTLQTDKIYLPTDVGYQLPKEPIGVSKVVTIALKALFVLAAVLLAGAFLRRMIVRSHVSSVPQQTPSTSQRPEPTRPAPATSNPFTHYTRITEVPQPKVMSNGFPHQLIGLLGGLDTFNKLPILPSENVKGEPLGNSYLTVDPKDMSSPIMIGEKGAAHFFCIRYRDKESKAVSVDVVFHRNSTGWWYINDEGSPMNFDPNLKGPLHFYQSLIQGNHKNFELASV